MPIEDERAMLLRDVMLCQAKLKGYEVGARRKALARLHPLVMGRIYFPEWMGKETPEFHWEIVDKFMTCSRWGVAAPVGSAKTTVLTKLGSLWSAFFEDWNPETLIVSLSADLVKVWLGEMGRACKENLELREDFGDFVGTHWGSDELEFEFAKPDGTHRYNLIRALGIGGSLRGRRPGRIILDDPQDESLVKSERQREDFSLWFWGALVNRLDEPHKKLTYIGTCISPETFLVGLVNHPPPGWTTKSYAMLDDQGRSLWETKYPTAFLQQRRHEIGEERFQAEFQNNPMRNAQGRMFETSQVTEKVWSPETDDLVTMAIDPSFTKGGDAWALTVVSQNRNNLWHVLYASKAQTGTEGWLEEMARVHPMFVRLLTVGIETGGGLKSIEYGVQQFMLRRGLNFHITWITHAWTQGKKSGRIAQLSPIINTGRLVLAPGLDVLARDLAAYRTGLENQEDHLLDSLAMHLELQVARRPYDRPEPTVEEVRAKRMQAYRKVWELNRRSRGGSHWDRYLA